MAQDTITPRNDLVSVGTSSVTISDISPTRSSITIRNTSTDTTMIMTVVLGDSAAVANKGAVLNRGDVFQDQDNGNYLCWRGPISVICAVANGQVSVQERK